jgi:hypothetical protein
MCYSFWLLKHPTLLLHDVHERKIHRIEILPIIFCFVEQNLLTVIPFMVKNYVKSIILYVSDETLIPRCRLGRVGNYVKSIILYVSNESLIPRCCSGRDRLGHQTAEKNLWKMLDFWTLQTHKQSTVLTVAHLHTPQVQYYMFFLMFQNISMNKSTEIINILSLYVICFEAGNN